MKLLQAVTLTAVLALITGTAALAGEGKGDGPRGGRGPGPMMENLLPPRIVDELNLTADQKTKLDELEAAFKKDAAAWDQAHPNFREDMRKARESNDKDAMHKLMQERKPLFETRKKYVDQFRTSLTDEQKAKLDKSLEQARERRGKGPRGDKAGGPPPPPPPAD